MDSGLSNQPPIRPWEGVYETYEEACSAAKAIGGIGLRGDAWFRRITQQLVEYRGELLLNSISMPPRPSKLPIVCALISPSVILDFGGSSGWCWDYLKESYSRHSQVSSYVIIETSEVVDYIKHLRLQAAPVSWQTLDDPLLRTDLLYCNSVLQYFCSNHAFISLVLRANPEFILIDDLVAGGEDDFFTLQMFRGSAIPYRFLGLQRFLGDLAMNGYREVARLPYASPINGVVYPLPMDNFPKHKQLNYSSSILLNRQSKSESR